MTKLQLLSLNDYLINPTDLELKLFVMSINPVFCINKKNSIDIITLIKKYDNDKIKIILSALETYLGAKQTKQTQTKQTQTKSIISEPIPVQYSETDKNDEVLRSNLIQSLIKLESEFMKNMETNNPTTIERNIDLKAQIKDIKIQLGSSIAGSELKWYRQGSNKYSKLDSKKAFVLGMFGDWNASNTKAWSLINENGVNQFIVSGRQGTGMGFDPREVYKMIEEVTGKTPINYNIVEDKENYQWIFSKSHVNLTSTITMNNGEKRDRSEFNQMSTIDRI